MRLRMTVPQNLDKNYPYGFKIISLLYPVIQLVFVRFRCSIHLSGRRRRWDNKNIPTILNCALWKSQQQINRWFRILSDRPDAIITVPSPFSSFGRAVLFAIFFFFW